MNLSPPPLQKITEAICSLEGGKSGSSQHAIAKFIEEKHYGGGLPQSFKRMLSNQLNELAKSGVLVKVKRSFKLPVKGKSKKKSVEIKERKKKRKIEVSEEELEINKKMVEKVMGFLKYAEKIERLRQLIPRRKKKEDLIQKQTANLEEWKKVSAISSVDLALVGSLEKLMQVQHELDEVKEQTVAKIRSLEDGDKEKLWKWQQENNDRELTGLYQERSKIIGSIPKFWSTAFMSDYSLRKLLNEEDEKIIKYLNSVVVEGCPDMTSECTITLNFDENPYFENSSLAKRFRFSHKGIVEISGTTITWKSGKGILTAVEEKREQLHSDMNKSFFSWFCEDSEKKPKLHDRVANLIACDLWCYAPDYFVNATQNHMNKAKLW